MSPKSKNYAVSEKDHDDFMDMKLALFGNEEAGEIGMVKKVDAMYDVFASLAFMGKFAAWAAVVLGGGATIWVTIWHFLTRQIK